MSLAALRLHLCFQHISILLHSALHFCCQYQLVALSITHIGGGFLHTRHLF